MMTGANRSLAACLRCRKQKLKCGGPNQIPCQRCRVVNAECVFVAPRTGGNSQSVAGNATAPSDVKMTLLEQRLDQLEQQHRSDMQEIHGAIELLKSKDSNLPGHAAISTFQVYGSDAQPEDYDLNNPKDPVMNSDGGVLDGWNEFYALNCRSVIGFMDDQMYPPSAITKQHPLMSSVIRTIASRAISPSNFPTYLATVEELIKGTFNGPIPDLLSLNAMMLFIAWTRRYRLWGYVVSIAVEMRLNETALQLDDSNIEHTEEFIQRARTWFSLCCFDLLLNLNRPFIINKMKDYLPLAEKLLASPYTRLVDQRICTYIDGFSIAGDAKSELRNSELLEHPLPQSAEYLLTKFDERVDAWFYAINNEIDPLYQTFEEQQDRNRFMVPYAFLKLKVPFMSSNFHHANSLHSFINGTALHGLTAGDCSADTKRLAFIQKALDNACLLIQTQFESKVYRERLRYTSDYNTTPTFYAIGFILKAVMLTHENINCTRSLKILSQAAQMIEQAGITDAANSLWREREKLAALTKTVLTSNSAVESESMDLFDIPILFNKVGGGF